MNYLDANECSPSQQRKCPTNRQAEKGLKGKQRGEYEGQAEGPPAVALICRLSDLLVLPEAVEQGRRPEDRVDDVTEAGGSWVGLLVQDPQLDTERTRRAQSE